MKDEQTIKTTDANASAPFKALRVENDPSVIVEPKQQQRLPVVFALKISTLEQINILSTKPNNHVLAFSLCKFDN